MVRYTNLSTSVNATYTPTRTTTTTSSIKIPLVMAITKITKITRKMTILIKKQLHSIISTNQPFKWRMIRGMDEQCPLLNITRSINLLLLTREATAR